MARTGAKPSPKHFVFKKHANIGSADANEDKKYLTESFIDNGELSILCDISKPQCIILGRTGSGKTALLEQLASSKDNVIKISPEGLALTYISNNDVLNFFTEAGVNMELFYRLLWRHVFAVEIIREHYHIVNEQTRDDFLTKIRDRLIRNKTRKDAIDYLLKWGESFWKDSEYRVKEITSTLEQNLNMSLGGEVKGSINGLVGGEVKLTAEKARKLTDEEKAEVIQRGQSVVNQVQMKTLSDIMDLLEKDILDDRQKKYFITIDRLDENWVNEDLRYRLIRALLDTVRDFNSKIQNVKIIVAIREDLLDRVFRYTRSAGYQEEKYKSLYLPLSWRKDELEEMLDRRVGQMVREQYTTKVVHLRDLLPARVYKGDLFDYVCARTMLRPRDIIMFFNECIRAAEGKAKLTQQIIFHAEAVYSEKRLRALADEWSADYPNLVELSLFLKKCNSCFKQDEIKGKIEECMLDFLIIDPHDDHIRSLVEEKFNNNDTDGFMQEMFKILYRVGLIGIKQESYLTVYWSYLGQKIMSSDINENATVYIHPAFWRVLGVVPV